MGLELNDSKQDLADHRLNVLATRLDLKSGDELVSIFRQNDQQQTLKQQIIDALVTNETQFFRDKAPFEDFETIIKQRHDLDPDHLIRIWCAAVSTGQEAYSLAMMLEKLKEQGNGPDYTILGTDISQKAIDRARKGAYNHFEIQRGLNIRQILEWFEEKDKTWFIDRKLRNHIQFRRMNLLKDEWPDQSFDFIFFRNILIYFGSDTRIHLLRKMEDVLSDDGYLLVGGSETLHFTTDRLKSAGGFISTLYQKADKTSSRKKSEKAPNDKADEGIPRDIKWPYQ